MAPAKPALGAEQSCATFGCGSWDRWVGYQKACARERVRGRPGRGGRRRARRVQMRGGDRRPHARRSFSTWSVRLRAPAVRVERRPWPTRDESWVTADGPLSAAGGAGAGAAEAGIEDVAKGVAEHVEAEDGEGDGGAGEDGHPGRAL